METKTVKLYSLDYSNAKTYLMAVVHCRQYGASSAFPPYTARWYNMVAHLFLYLDRRLQIRLESGIADCRSFSGNQFTAVRNASSGSASRHSVEVRITGGSSRLGGTPLQPHLSAYFISCRTVLSGGRYFRRVGYGWQLLPGRTRFPYRSAGNGDAGSRRVCVDKI